MGLTSDEFEEMEYRQFTELSEIFDRRYIEDWKRVRLIAAASLGADPRKIVSLPGDFDHVPKLKSKEENLEILRIHGIDKLLFRDGRN